MLTKILNSILFSIAFVTAATFVYVGYELGAPSRESKLSNATVMITNLAKNSGGSGVILKSGLPFSSIMTNGHVCEVAKRGGLVIEDNGTEHLVVDYTKSRSHDLCVIRVAGDLHINTPLAKQAPFAYEKAVIAGHPKLLPTILTTGHFSKHLFIQVLTGFKPCTPEEEKSGMAIFCVLLGGIPIVKNYDSVVVSATIMPGSSGSTIYTENDEIGAVVFAGSGELGYAFAVPYEFVHNFINNELPFAAYTTPNPSLPDEREEAKARIKKSCETTQDKKALEVCATIRNWILVKKN